MIYNIFMLIKRKKQLKTYKNTINNILILYLKNVSFRLKFKII